MKEMKYIGWLLIGLLWLTACSKTGESADEDMEEFSLSFSVQSVEKDDISIGGRTVLPGKEPVQHVTYVQLYIFDGTENESVCVASENVYWKHWQGANDGISSRDQKYAPIYQLKDWNKEYTFLAIGLDVTRTDEEIAQMDNSAATYNLPQAIEVGRTTLGDAVAQLASGKTKEDIFQSELFAGFKVLTKSDLTTTPRIDLYRRVAGVMGYFKNIPVQVEGKDVHFLQVRLYTKQNTQVSLKKIENGSVFSDYITSPLDTDEQGEVLVEMPVYGYVQGEVVSKGSYVLPAVSAKGNETTMIMVLADENRKELVRKKIICVNTEGPYGSRVLSRGETDEGTGIIGGNNSEEVEFDEEAYHYHIIANHYYGIGSPEKPIDLSNTSYVIVTINPNWDENHNMSI